MNLKLTFASALSAVGLFAALAVPAHAAFLYSSGPVNGTLDGWYINDHAVTDSFDLSAGGLVDSALYYTWEIPGNYETSVDWAITTAPLGGTTIASGVDAPVTATVFPAGVYDNAPGTPYAIGYGGAYSIDSNVISLGGVDLSPGTYYLELSGATDTGGESAWDENDGAGVAYDSGFGPTSPISGTESFNLYGTSYVPTPEASSYIGLLLGVAGLAAFGVMSARRRRTLSL